VFSIELFYIECVLYRTPSGTRRRRVCSKVWKADKRDLLYHKRDLLYDKRDLLRISEGGGFVLRFCQKRPNIKTKEIQDRVNETNWTRRRRICPKVLSCMRRIIKEGRWTERFY
jgi:hypothetical protein